MVLALLVRATVALAVAVLGSAAAPAATPAAYGYDGGIPIGTSGAVPEADGALDLPFRGVGSATPHVDHRYDDRVHLARASARLDDAGSAPQTAGGGGRVFTHFTDEAGAAGITGTRPLAVGESVEVGQLTFGKGANPFLVGEGRTGVTDLGLDATPGQLERIGVFGSRQQYGIRFSELDAWNSGVRVRGDLPSRNIYSIPGGCTITGTCTVTRLR